MSQPTGNATLLRALAVSSQMFEAAERADVPNVTLLDAERMQLLQSFKSETRHVDAGSRALLQQITQLNDRTIGLLIPLKKADPGRLTAALAQAEALAKSFALRKPWA